MSHGDNKKWTDHGGVSFSAANGVCRAEWVTHPGWLARLFGAGPVTHVRWTASSIIWKSDEGHWTVSESEWLKGYHESYLLKLAYERAASNG